MIKFKTKKLTDEQKTYYEGIKWIVSNDQRRVGRTMLLGMAFLEQAFSHTGEWIQVYDHHDYSVQDERYIVSVIANLFNDIDYSNIPEHLKYELSVNQEYEIRVSLL